MTVSACEAGGVRSFVCLRSPHLRLHNCPLLRRLLASRHFADLAALLTSRRRRTYPPKGHQNRHRNVGTTPRLQFGANYEDRKLSAGCPRHKARENILGTFPFVILALTLSSILIRPRYTNCRLPRSLPSSLCPPTAGFILQVNSHRCRRSCQ